MPTLLSLSGCGVAKTPMEPSPLDDFAKCLSAEGVKIYGSITCSICARQKKLFGNAYQYLEEIECHPKGDNSQAELCLEVGIEKTPTWVLEQEGKELKRLEGYQTAETLSKISGCTY